MHPFAGWGFCVIQVTTSPVVLFRAAFIIFAETASWLFRKFDEGGTTDKHLIHFSVGLVKGLLLNSGSFIWHQITVTVTSRCFICKDYRILERKPSNQTTKKKKGRQKETRGSHLPQPVGGERKEMNKKEAKHRLILRTHRKWRPETRKFMTFQNRSWQQEVDDTCYNLLTATKLWRIGLMNWY